MKREITVPLSLLSGGFALAAREFFWEGEEWAEPILFWIIIVAGVRAVILWFQTFYDAVAPENQVRARVGWVFAHLFLGFVASYLYYFTVQWESKLSDEERDEDIKRRANEGTLR
jgi:hypothetical protein